MNIDVTMNLELVDDIKEATHIIALKDYGEIKRGEMVQYANMFGHQVIHGTDLREITEAEEQLLVEWKENLCYKVHIAAEHR